MIFQFGVFEPTIYIYFLFVALSLFFVILINRDTGTHKHTLALPRLHGLHTWEFTTQAKCCRICSNLEKQHGSQAMNRQKQKKNTQHTHTLDQLYQWHPFYMHAVFPWLDPVSHQLKERIFSLQCHKKHTIRAIKCRNEMLLPMNTIS